MTKAVLVVTANSDGVVRVWKVGGKEVSAAKQEKKDTTQIEDLEVLDAAREPSLLSTNLSNRRSMRN
jgi:hypothetical protein